MEQTLWSHLPLLVRSNSKDSVEYILQALWRTRKTGLDPADRDIIRDMLQLQNESTSTRCVYDNIGRDEIQKLFPSEVLPELQRLLTLLLQKFQREWRQDVLKDQNSRPGGCYQLEAPNDSQSRSKESEVKFELANDTLETMLNSMYSIRDQLSNVGEASNDYLSQDANLL
ncbi:uncharacterized protein Pyn_06712 [Prunus yedoensis var. nudiflora]|uniref:COMM domain-containing protein n=1 Tax=Prunus yedoensis var. nudiflora TaxID=2094558 RepID=A0A314ZFK3_PRUYE|nr:uncharacterized protein Pyn_06712 [Prunus yedoensis var. nudiflora]